MPKPVRISELLDSRFGTVVKVLDATVRRPQIACPIAEEQLGRSARLRLSAEAVWKRSTSMRASFIPQH